MLKKVVFLVADQRQGKAIEEMKKNMGDKAENIFYGNADDLKNAGMEDCLKEEILFVTDSSAILTELQQRGDHAIALLPTFAFENHQQEDLSGAAYAVTDIEDLEWESLEKVYLRLAGKPWTVMETERCIIRETTVEDVGDFYRIYAEPSITRYMEDLFQDPADETGYIKSYIREIYGFYGYGMWSILHKGNQEVIGRAGLSWRQGFSVPELGFVIAVPYQRQGYAYEVCAAIVNYGEEELGFDEIQALVQKENQASIQLCLKLGFVWEDTVTDQGVCYERFMKRSGNL